MLLNTESRMVLLITTLALCLSTRAFAQESFKVSTDFEGGSAKILEINSIERIVRITPGGDADRGWVCWWAFRLDNLEPGQSFTVEVHVSDQPTRNQGKLTNKTLAAGWSMPTRAAISSDGRIWRHSVAGKREPSHIRYQIVSESESMWIAWGPLFTPRDTTELLNEVTAGIPGATSFELARSRAGRPVMAFRTGQLDGESRGQRPAVWIQARQHAWESGSSWVARGLVEWLMAGDQGARWLIDNAEVVVVPIMDVDNVTTGNGGKEEDPRDHNRDWDDAPVFPEVAAAQRHLQKWAREDRLDFFIDLHNPAPNDPRPFFFAGPPDLLSVRGRSNRALFLEIAGKHLSGPLAVEADPRITGPSYHPLWRKISGQWVMDNGNDHTVAICLETAWNTPASTTDGYRSVGRQLGEAIAEYLQRRTR